MLGKFLWLALSIFIPPLTGWVVKSLESPCCSNFVVIISALKGWIDLKFGVWLYISGVYVGAVQYLDFLFVLHFAFCHLREELKKIFCTKILAPNEWINFNFGVWPYIGVVYVFLDAADMYFL